MPLEKLHPERDRVWGLWRITEPEHALAAQVEAFERIPESLHHPRKRLEFYAGRVLVKKLMETLNLEFRGVHKDAFGKPFPVGSDFQLSLSHSYPYVAALLDARQAVGIDLEQPKEKLLNIAARVLDKIELNDAGQDIVKHCVYWSAKETLIKIHGKKDFVLAENIHIDPFELSARGDINGLIIENESKTKIPLEYIVTSEFVLVFNKSAL